MLRPGRRPSSTSSSAAAKRPLRRSSCWSGSAASATWAPRCARDACGRWKVLYDGIDSYAQGASSAAEAHGAGLEAWLEIAARLTRASRSSAYHDPAVTAIALDRPRAAADRAPVRRGAASSRRSSRSPSRSSSGRSPGRCPSRTLSRPFPRRLPRSPARALRRSPSRVRPCDARVLPRVPPRLPDRVVQPRDAESLAQWTKGMVKFVLHFLFLVAGVALICARGLRFYWRRARGVRGGIAANGAYGLVAARRRGDDRRNLDEAWLQPITGGASKINIFGAIERLASTGQRAHRRPEPSRHRGRCRILLLSHLPPSREGPPAAPPARVLLTFLRSSTSRRCRAAASSGSAVDFS